MTREQKIHIIVSVGVVTVTVLNFFPDYASHSAVLAMLVNLIWIWE